MKPALTLIALLACAAHVQAVDYAKDIQPLFDERCTDCHSASDADGDFALDSFDALIKGGKSGKALVAGNSQDSLLVKFLEGRSGKTGKNQFMPPGKKEHLSSEQITLVRKWIDEGAIGAPGSKPADPLAKLPKVASKSGVKPIHAVATSSDGKLIALGRFGVVELIDATTRQSLRMLTGITGKASSLAFSKDAASLFVAAGDAGINGIAYQFNTSDGKLARRFTGHTDALYALALSPDGRQLATGGYDQKIKLWDIANGKERTTIKGHNGSINALTFRPDGKVLASASSDRTVKLWDANSGARLETFSQPLKEQLALAFSADGKTLIAGGGDSRIRQWSISDKATEGSNPLLETKFAHEGSVLALVMSPDGKSFASSASDRTLKLWEASSLAHKKQLAMQSDWAGAVAWLGNTLLIAARQDGSASLNDVSSGKAEPLIAATRPSGPIDLHTTATAEVRGTLTKTGQRDEHRFTAKAGMTVVLDLEARRIQSKAETIQLELFDAAGNRLFINHGLDSGTDPLIAFQVKQDGDYIARVSETTLEGSDKHTYRLTITTQPYVTGLWPLSVKTGAESTVHLVGYNLGNATITIKPTASGMAPLPAKAGAYRFRYPLNVIASDLNESLEQEPNSDITAAQMISAPASMNGRIFSAQHPNEPDTDVFAFRATAGEEWIIETHAAQANSPVDTRLEILNADGTPVERMKLQAVRSSFNNFRGVDADNPDIRLENYTETGLNEFVYFNGDIMRTFRLPRGPDGGFLFYSSNGKRRAYFDTTATSHPLDEPCYIVEPLKPSQSPLPNGLPVLSLNYANDDDGLRKLGRDSRLHFTAPKSASYLVRVGDSRGWSGERFAYRLLIRKPAPDFSVALKGDKQTVPAGSAMGFSLRADRIDDYEGAITINISGLPQGWFASTPVVIEAGHTLASGSLFAASDAVKDADWSKVKITATGNGKVHDVNNFGAIKLGPMPGFVANLEPAVNDRPVTRTTSQPQVITIEPGRIVNAFIRVDRHKNDGLLNFDVHGLPHGIIVDDIGLNGIQVREKETEREIRFACSKWVQPQERLIHACVSSTRNEADSAGLATSFPVLLRVVKPAMAAK